MCAKVDRLGYTSLVVRIRSCRGSSHSVIRRQAEHSLRVYEYKGAFAYKSGNKFLENSSLSRGSQAKGMSGGTLPATPEEIAVSEWLRNNL